MDRWVGYILVGVAIMVALAATVTVMVRLRRSDHGPWLAFLLHLNELVTKCWWRMKRVGPSTVPSQGPCIITANHTCSADPLFLLAATPHRTFAFMVAVEYTRWPVARSLLPLIECIPVRREDQDTGATKQAIRHLRAGKALGIFIEGRIVPPGQTIEPKHGVAMLALRTGAKVIPVHISGTVRSKGIVRGFFLRHQVRIRFGRPIDVTKFHTDKTNRETLATATRNIQAAIQHLAPPAQPDQDPSSAPRRDEAGGLPGPHDGETG